VPPQGRPDRGELDQTEQAALAEAPPGTSLEVVLEPTGPSWLPIAVFFTSRGHTVYRVSSAKAHDLRRVLWRQAKSNGIDADTLARLPLQLPGAERAALDRRVRACDRLTSKQPITSAVSRTWSASCCPPARLSASSAWPTWRCWNALAATPTRCWPPAPAGLPG
jgi:hypothetical protein